MSGCIATANNFKRFVWVFRGTKNCRKHLRGAIAILHIASFTIHIVQDPFLCQKYSTYLKFKMWLQKRMCRFCLYFCHFSLISLFTKRSISFLLRFILSSLALKTKTHSKRIKYYKYNLYGLCPLLTVTIPLLPLILLVYCGTFSTVLQWRNLKVHRSFSKNESCKNSSHKFLLMQQKNILERHTKLVSSILNLRKQLRWVLYQW